MRLVPSCVPTFTLLSCSPNFPRASITRYTHAKHEQILKELEIIFWFKILKFVDLSEEIRNDNNNNNNKRSENTNLNYDLVSLCFSQSV